MVDKADLPDYYAALELRPSADQAEITKQYKKLALIWHPDRNPGKEDVVKPKFQAIQAAHEVLKDPALRQHYDFKRRQRTNESVARPNNPVRNQFAGAYASQRAANPPFHDRRTRREQASTAGRSYTSWTYNPPPRTAGPQPPPATGPPPSAGAARFSHDFNRPPPPPPGTQAPHAYNRNTTGQGEAESRAEAWRNFYNKKPQPDRGKAAGFQSAEEGTRGEQSSRPAFARTNTSSSGTARFNPNLPGGQWEPQAQNTSSYNTYTRPAPPPPHINLPPPPRPNQGYSPRHPRNRDHRGEDIPYAEGNPRISTPYATKGGETTYFSIDDLKRSNSTRDAPGLAKEARHQAQNTAPFGKASSRARSASPPSRRKPDQSRSTREWSAAADDDEGYTPRRPPDPDQTSRSSRPQPRPPRRRASPSSTAANYGGSKKDGASAKKDGPRPKNDGGISSSLFDLGRPSSSDADSSSGAESVPTRRRNPSTEGQQKKKKAEPSTFWRTRKQQASATQASEDTSTQQADSSKPEEESEQHRHFAGSERSTNASTFGTRSNGPISTQFFSGEWNGQFRGSSRTHSQGHNESNSRTEHSPAPSSSHWIPRPSTSSTERNPFDPNDIKLDPRAKNGTPGPKTNGATATPFKAPTTDPFMAPTTDSFAALPKTNEGTTSPFNVPPPPPGSPPKNDTVPPSTEESRSGSVKFSSEEWKKQFAEPKWAFPQPSDGRTSPSKGTVPSRRTSIAEADRKKPRKHAAATTVKEETDESEVPKKRVPPPANSTPATRITEPKPNSPDAMDIDADPAASFASPRGPRLVPAEATRTEWRDPFSSSSATGAVPSAVPNAVPPPTTLPGPPPGPPPKMTSRPLSSSRDTLNLSGLADAAPFNGTTGASINDLSDLNTGLPFQSAASNKAPKSSRAPKRPHVYPKLSNGPRAPAVLHGKLTQDKLKAYFASMASYMEKHHEFEGEILSHLNRRYEYDARFGSVYKAKTLIDTVGDSSKGTGVEALAGDLALETFLLDAYAKHKKEFRSAMEELVKVKQRAATGVARD